MFDGSYRVQHASESSPSRNPRHPSAEPGRHLAAAPCATLAESLDAGGGGRSAPPRGAPGWTPLPEPVAWDPSPLVYEPSRGRAGLGGDDLPRTSDKPC